MDAARWHEIKTAFDSLLELETSLRSIEVGKIGVRDPELGRALEGLLSAHFGVGSFLLPKVTVETPTISREFLIRRV